jgi:2-dehydro-3-deoxyphosphogluconate aldolase/(4S)-4-hydroxy-2-oxoglutarate aldolase
VNPENAASYLKAGANLLSFGASIYDPKLMAAGDWNTIKEKLKVLLAAIK